MQEFQPSRCLSPSTGTFWFDVTRGMGAALTADFTQGFNQLMDFDAQSIRAYLLSQGYTNPEVDWTETINDATGHYDMYSMSQGVLEEWIFTEAQNWRCINGGMDRITYRMTEIIKNKPIIGSQVTVIKPDGNGGLTVVVNGTQETNYAHIISNLPLSALQIVGLTETDLNYTQRIAIRKLNYDPALKIGMKFKTRWWENLPSPFIGGQSYSDLPSRRCVYPSYGVNLPNDTAPGTMIASYVWGQDSSRLGAYMQSASALETLVSTTLTDLASMNNISLSFLEDQYIAYHAWDWYHTEWSVGAFAIFGPDQFSNVLPTLMMPVQEGHLHFGGEALSSGHAWIIGAGQLGV